MAQPPTLDGVYTNLLGHLQRPNSRLQPQSVLSAVSYYLSYLPIPHPTQLTAFVISSPLWQPLSLENLWPLVNAFRSAVHLKNTNIEKAEKGWLSRSSETLLGEWIQSVMRGVSRGDAKLRMVVLGGLLFGLEDLTREETRVQNRERVEEQVVIACAEVLETFPITQDSWKNEFTIRGNSRLTETNGSIFLYVACQILPLVSSNKFRALDLSALIKLSQSAINETFLHGNFLNDLPIATTRGPGGQVNISPGSRLSKSLAMVSGNPLYKTAGPLAKLLSRALSQYAEDRHADAWHAFDVTSQSLESIVSRVEKDWKPSQLAEVTSEKYIGHQSRETSTEIWSILKTLLFSCILVSQSILSDVSYMKPLQTMTSEPSPSSLARSTLRSLHHFSFILSHFGGVTSTGEGFRELKRVFYMALDIFAADPNTEACNSFVEELLSTRDSQMDAKHPFLQAKTAYVFAVVEQLVPILTESILENQVIPFCHSYLGDPQNRETYESAHSVVLSIFAAHAQKSGEDTAGKPTLAKKLVPFYVDSLITNSSESRLSREQLKLAFSSLVRSATSSGDDALVWLCVQALLSRIEASSPGSARSTDLHVTLVSLISCVPLSLLPKELHEVERILDTLDSEDRKTLADAVLEEITNRVGDREREVALTWWCSVISRLSAGREEQAPDQ